MKIKEKELSIKEVLKLPHSKHCYPHRQSVLLQKLIHFISKKELASVGFSYTVDDTAKALIESRQPCLIFMNHSCFLDLQIVNAIYSPATYCIVCTSDGLVGKKNLMRHLGCIPTNKFVSDVTLIRDMKYAFEKLKTSVLMYPEASYSFDGCATPLPKGLGRLLQMLKVPVIMIRTFGAFSRDPLYNGLQKRQVPVSAKVSCLFDKEEIAQKSVEELDNVLEKAFTFDSFRWQAENKIEITEPFRADGLERILYRCPSCLTEAKLEGKGTEVTCLACGKKHELHPLGHLIALQGKTDFPFVSDWYRWEREEVRKEILSGTYRWEADVEIRVMVDYKAIYHVGTGHLLQTEKGFTLTGCDGEINYHQSPLSCYSLYSDYCWYEIGDMVCIGNGSILYYCFPKDKTPVAKARIAAEELFKLAKEKKEKVTV